MTVLKPDEPHAARVSYGAEDIQRGSNLSPLVPVHSESAPADFDSESVDRDTGTRPRLPDATANGINTHHGEYIQVEANRNIAVEGGSRIRHSPAEMDRDPKEIGNRIAKLREGARLSQDELAKAIGVRMMTISRAETGWNKTGPKPETLSKLAQYFRVAEAYLLFGSDDERKKSDRPVPMSVEQYITEEGPRLDRNMAERLRKIDYATLCIPSPTVQDVRRVRELIELNLALAKKR